MTNVNLNELAVNAKRLSARVASTIAKYNSVAIELHEVACMTFLHVAEGNDPLPLNLFYKGLRVNDQTALRVWFGKHATYTEGDKVMPWIKFTTEKGFALIKGKEEHRKDKFTVTGDEKGKTQLITLEPFYSKNVKDKDAYTLDQLVAMLAAAADRVEKKAETNNLVLPKETKELLASVKKNANAEVARIQALN